MGDPGKTIVIGRRTFAALMCLFALAALLHPVSRYQWFGKERVRSTLFRTEAEALRTQDSPHLQLVGYVTWTYRPGVFSSGRQGAETHLTVLCRGGEYFGAPGQPRDVLRRLVSSDDYPLLARGPAAPGLEGGPDEDPLRLVGAEKLDAKSDKGALAAATARLKGS